jgi:hypothetical protein
MNTTRKASYTKVPNPIKPLFLTLALSLAIAGCAKKEAAAEAKPDKPKEVASLELQKPVDTDITKKEGPKPLIMVGSYTGQITFPPGFFETMKEQAAQNNIKAEDVERLEAELKDSHMTLDLKADGTYLIFTESAGKSDSRNGKWTFDPAKKLLVIARPQGETEGTDKEFVVSDDGRTLVFVGANDGVEVTITFKKS